MADAIARNVAKEQAEKQKYYDRVKKVTGRHAKSDPKNPANQPSSASETSTVTEGSVDVVEKGSPTTSKQSVTQQVSSPKSNTSYTNFLSRQQSIDRNKVSDSIEEIKDSAGRVVGIRDKARGMNIGFSQPLNKQQEQDILIEEQRRENDTRRIRNDSRSGVLDSSDNSGSNNNSKKGSTFKEAIQKLNTYREAGSFGPGAFVGAPGIPFRLERASENLQQKRDAANIQWIRQGTGRIKGFFLGVAGVTVDTAAAISRPMQTFDTVSQSIINFKETREGLYGAGQQIMVGNPGTQIGTVAPIVASEALLFTKPIKKLRTNFQAELDKALPSRPFYVKQIDQGVEIHKGTFDQYALIYKGQSFQRQGKTFGVRRVQQFDLGKPSTWVDNIKGKKQGQIKYFDNFGESTILRETPSEFASPATEASLGGSTQTIISVTPDSKFLKAAQDLGGGYTSISGGGKPLNTIKGRAGVGGGELGQFFSARTTKSINGFPKGSPQAYTFYAGQTGSKYSDWLAGRQISFGNSKPGIIVQQELISRPTSTKKDYVELAQDLAGYTEPGTTQLSASTLKNVRSELEVIKSPQTVTQLKPLKDVNIPGKGSFNTFYGRNVELSKQGKISAFDNNIDFLNQRISQVEDIAKAKPGLRDQANRIILREKENIAKIEAAKQDLLIGNKGSKFTTSNVNNDFSSSTKSFSGTNQEATAILNNYEFGKTTKSFSVTPKFDFGDVTPGGSLSASRVSNSQGVSPVFTTYLSTPTQGSVLSSGGGGSAYSLNRDFVPPSPSTPSLSPSKSAIVISSSPVSSSSSSVPSGDSRGSGRRSGNSSKTSPYTPSDLLTSPSPSRPSPSSSVISPGRGRSGAGSSSTSSSFSGVSYGPSYGYSPTSTTVPGRGFGSRRSNDNNQFFAFVRTQGSFKKIGAFSTPTKAFSSGLRRVSNTAAASFKVTGRGGQAITGFNTPSSLRFSKQERGVYVERRSRRIKSSGELNEITFKGVSSSRQQNKKKLFGL